MTMSKSGNIYFFIIMLIISLVSCDNGKTGMPKPRTYPRVDFPEKKYKLFNPGNCPFEFEIPA